jgi:hypothetical protein
VNRVEEEAGGYEDRLLEKSAGMLNFDYPLNRNSPRNSSRGNDVEAVPARFGGIRAKFRFGGISRFPLLPRASDSMLFWPRNKN